MAATFSSGADGGARANLQQDVLLLGVDEDHIAGVQAVTLLDLWGGEGGGAFRFVSLPNLYVDYGTTGERI